jgi:hypothetical protein
MKTQAALQRRVAEGTSDPVEGAQPPRPEFDGALVGKRMEVLWRYTDRESGVGMLIWTPGRVVRVADGNWLISARSVPKTCCQPVPCVVGVGCGPSVR